MSNNDGNKTDQPGDGSASRAEKSSRKLHEIFGDVLPDTTADERGPGSSSGYDDQWYLENRPPHHNER